MSDARAAGRRAKLVEVWRCDRTELRNRASIDRPLDEALTQLAINGRRRRLAVVACHRHRRVS